MTMTMTMINMTPLPQSWWRTRNCKTCSTWSSWQATSWTLAVMQVIFNLQSFWPQFLICSKRKIVNMFWKILFFDQPYVQNRQCGWNEDLISTQTDWYSIQQVDEKSQTKAKNCNNQWISDCQKSPVQAWPQPAPVHRWSSGIQPAWAALCSWGPRDPWRGSYFCIFVVLNFCIFVFFFVFLYFCIGFIHATGHCP